MNRFVEECRDEWRRLGVPDASADEMAAELAADLQQAEAEGESTAAVLGGAALDPRAFAAAWATERGVIGRPSRGRKWGLAAVVGVFAVVAIAGAVLVVLAAPSKSERLAVDAPFVVSPDGRTVALMRTRAPVPAPPPDVAPVLITAQPARVVDVDESGDDTRTLGAALLAVGLTGLVLLTLLSVWRGPAARPAR